MARGGRRGRPQLNRGNQGDMEPSTTEPAATAAPEQVIDGTETQPKQPTNRIVIAKGQTLTRVLPAFASLVDPNEGTTLEFIPVIEINGTKCAQLNVEDIEDEVTYWQNAVLCCVLGANPPYEVIAGFVNRIWGEFAIDKVLMVKRGLYLVRFEDYQAALTVAQKAVYCFDQKPFIVKAWTLERRLTLMQLPLFPFGFNYQNKILNTRGCRA